MDLLLSLVVTFPFWIFVAWFVITGFFVKEDRYISPIIVGVAAMLVNKHFFHINSFSYIKENLESIIAYAVVYLAIGVVWSFFKWYMVLIEIRNSRDKKERKMLWTISDMTASNWKESIITWILYWPFSLIGFICADFVYGMAEIIYKIFSNLYDRMAKKILNIE